MVRRVLFLFFLLFVVKTSYFASKAAVLLAEVAIFGSVGLGRLLCNPDVIALVYGHLLFESVHC